MHQTTFQEILDILQPRSSLTVMYCTRTQSYQQFKEFYGNSVAILLKKKKKKKDSSKEMMLEAFGILPVCNHAWLALLAPKNWRAPVCAGIAPS